MASTFYQHYLPLYQAREQARAPRYKALHQAAMKARIEQRFDRIDTLLDQLDPAELAAINEHLQSIEVKQAHQEQLDRYASMTAAHQNAFRSR